ncbi:MAG: PLP-dependent transferase, partial [Tuberibacillus sp.]
MDKKLRFETAAIHGGYEALNHQGSLVTPLYQTSTFVFDDAERGERRFAGEENGYIYTRLGNPTVRVLEDRIAEMENGEKALAFTSGMAAVSALLIYLTKSGDHILCSEGLYGCTFGLLTMMEKKFNITHDFSPLADEETIRSMIRDNTTCIYV